MRASKAVLVTDSRAARKNGNKDEVMSVFGACWKLKSWGWFLLDVDFNDYGFVVLPSRFLHLTCLHALSAPELE